MRLETYCVPGGISGALAVALAGCAGNSEGEIALMTNCLPPWGTMASSGTTKASGLTANTAETRANIPGRKGPEPLAPEGAERARSNWFGGHPRLWGVGKLKLPLTGPLPLPGPALLGGLLALPSATFTGLAACGFLLADCAGDPVAASGLAGAPAALPSGFLAPAGAIGSPGPLARTARIPIERPFGSIKGSSASTLALYKRPGNASILSSTI